MGIAAHPIEERFWPKVDRSAGPDGCWPYTKALYWDGYGKFFVRSGPGRSTVHERAHRVAYELEVGPIPDGMVLDHTCHNETECSGGPECPHRRCCNPAHLEPIDNETNKRRSHNWGGGKEHCKNGHEFTPENTYFAPGAPRHRHCRACRIAALEKYKRRQRGALTHMQENP